MFKSATPWGCVATRMLAAIALVLLGAQASLADAGFQRWIAEFRAVAIQNGISGRTYDRAFQGVTAPDPEVLEKAHHQPEFRAEPWEYFDNRINEGTVSKGRMLARQWAPWLDRIEQHFGVSRYILLAIWSIESNYGEALKNPRVMRSLPRSLATLAYADPKRAKFARTQLIAALKILERGDIDVGHLTSSWAGAMGHTQFIPTSYQAYAVDMDGDGRRDIWNSVPDALATAANLLRKNGWQPGETWGYEVVLPPGRKFPAGTMPLSRWASIGVVRANGKAFPRPSQAAELKVPDGREGPAFLMIKNFFVLKRYNNADTYALAVGLLADQIAGYGGLVRDWNRPFERLTHTETAELQQRLGALGYYDGPIDGKIGSGSRKAIMEFQARMGMTQNGYPSKAVLMKLRGH
ncbi:lytic murein transglycosylase [Chelativorans sp. SCAU2101]|jgi:lytic murein transglycosylase|uniref:Lytic murein transglycosylase n=1 Tax=Chelativorans petroleitrophicus TaxID=2975484 RepID=A0A9X2X6K9_9HYPH|nr:lytic murein transglycosylase [Chelativorans petroleitrophicus]MCT8989845.1 lytic murein transglycosylase [Chelativorans petroleitrophicus]